MLLLTNTLLGRKVMSLRNGRPVAITIESIINPNNLKVEGFYCHDSIDKKILLVLLSQDVRDILPAGIVVNDHDVLSDPADLIRLKSILDLNFSLIGKPVFTEHKKRLGKINDYACDAETMFIQKLYVGRPLVKSLSTGSLSIDRNQIVEITNRKIVVKDPLQLQRSSAVTPALTTVPAA